MPIVQPPAFNFQQYAPSTPSGEGFFGGMAASILAIMQQQKENQFRVQQLAEEHARQQALDAYYKGTLGVQNREQDRLMADQQQKIGAQRQVGGAMQSALGMGQPSQQTQAPQGPTSTIGNTTQSQGPGEFKQILGGGAQAIGGTQGMQAIFGGVAPENMGAAVAGVHGVQELMPQPAKPPELPASAKEMEYYKSLPPAEAARYKAMFLDKAPTTVINNIPAKGATKFQEKDAENQADVIKESEDQARQAFASLPAITESYRMLERGDVYTGMGAKAKLQAARIASMFGVADAQVKVANTQTLQKLTGEQVLSYLRTRVLGSNNAVSDGDRIFMEGQSGRDITQDKLSLMKTMRINYGAAILRQSEAISDLRSQAQTYPEDASNLMRRSLSIEKRYEASWKNYAQMLTKEGESEDAIRSRMIGAGIRDPDAILRGLNLKPPTTVDLGNTLFPAR